MSFRFRRSVRIVPGVRINFGKSGASVSAGVRGARVTFGRSGGRATVGIPKTGVSYTQKISAKKVSGGKLLVLLIIPLLIIGILARLSRQSPSDAGQFTAIIVLVAVIGVIGLFAVLLRGKSADNGAVEPQQPDVELEASGVTGEPDIPSARASWKAIMREAAAKKQEREAAAIKQKREEEEILARGEQRLAETLGRYKCYYKHNEETLGPVTLWQVREMIEMDLFDPDVQVILEGSDYWYTYAEQELRVAPPASGNTKALHVAAKLPCYYLHEEKIHGPVSLLVIFHKIRLGELPADVRIRAEGSEEWRRASDV